MSYIDKKNVRQPARRATLSKGPPHDSPLTHKLDCFLMLTPKERFALSTLENEQITLNADTDIICAGDTYDQIFVMQEGWAIRYKVLSDGGRMITNFILPSDFICLHALFFKEAKYSISTVTPVKLACFPPKRIIDLILKQPRLALAIAWCNAHEESILLEHLTNLSRRTAYARLSHLLLELWKRLASLGLTKENRFLLPITQLELADSLGLSHSHVSRTLKRLVKQKIITTKSSQPREILILNEAALKVAAGFDEEFLHFMKMPSQSAAALRRPHTPPEVAARRPRR